MRFDKKVVLWMICIAVVLLLLSQFVLNSSFFLEHRVRLAKESLSELVMNDEIGLHELAAAIHDEAEKSGTDLSYDKYRNNLPGDLLTQLQAFLERCPAEIDEVYVGGQTVNVYPEGACVFRRTIENSNRIYAWVDLIYVPIATQQNENWHKDYFEDSTRLTPEWYIAVLYGF